MTQVINDEIKIDGKLYYRRSIPDWDSVNYVLLDKPDKTIKHIIQADSNERAEKAIEIFINLMPNGKYSIGYRSDFSVKYPVRKVSTFDKQYTEVTLEAEIEMIKDIFNQCQVGTRDRDMIRTYLERLTKPELF